MKTYSPLFFFLNRIEFNSLHLLHSFALSTLLLVTLFVYLFYLTQFDLEMLNFNYEVHLMYKLNLLILSYILYTTVYTDGFPFI